MDGVEREEVAYIIEKEVRFVSKDVPGVKYRILQTLGTGSYGCVCSAERTTDGKKVAMKFPRLSGVPEFEVEVNIVREMSMSDCNNITRFLDVTKALHPSLLVTGMVIELCHFEIGKFWAMERRAMTSSVLIVILQQIWNGLGHLHSKGYIHQDVAVRNILIDANTGTIKLADFGCATRDGGEVTFKEEVTGLAHGLSDLASNSSQPKVSNTVRMMKFKEAFANDALFQQHFVDVEEILPYVFAISCCQSYDAMMRRNKLWWEERVEEAPHLQEIANKAIQWMHTNPEAGGIALPDDVGRLFVRCFGFQGYKAIDASGIASDFRRFTTSAMEEECKTYFQEFLKDESRSPSPSLTPPWETCGMRCASPPEPRPPCRRCLKYRRNKLMTYENFYKR